MRPRPDFIIIGAMKCATSTLHEQLARQPGIVMSEPKEPCFFSDDAVYARGMDWYRALFARAAAEDLCGESSTHYTKLPTYPCTIQRIQHAAPATRFIYVMRHPVDRLISAYIHEWTERTINCPLEQAVRDYPRLTQYSQYAMQLQPYFDAFGRDAVLPVFFESLITRPRFELERVCRFLGYRGQPTWDPGMEAQNASAQRLRTCGWRDAIVHAPVLSSIRKRWIPQRVRDSVKRLWLMNRRPELSDATRRRLEALFNEDLSKLSPWLGFSLDCAALCRIKRGELCHDGGTGYRWVHARSDQSAATMELVS